MRRAPPCGHLCAMSACVSLMRQPYALFCAAYAPPIRNETKSFAYAPAYALLCAAYAPPSGNDATRTCIRRPCTHLVCRDFWRVAIWACPFIRVPICIHSARGIVQRGPVSFLGVWAACFKVSFHGGPYRSSGGAKNPAIYATLNFLKSNVFRDEPK